MELQLIETALENLAPALLVGHEGLDTPETLEDRLILLLQPLQPPVEMIEVSEDRAELLVDRVESRGGPLIYLDELLVFTVRAPLRASRPTGAAGRRW